MNTTPAFTINPAAGAHNITSSPLELEAARRAAEVSLQEMPYYQERYGDRGRLFGYSDGAWLATLCRGGPENTESQVLWLGCVLSSRGMPQWLLERHLAVLHAELMRACSDGASCYALLLQAAGLLRRQREKWISDAATQELAGRFSREADAAWVRRIPEMGALLVAAVADEANGIANAVRSIEPWARDPARFPETWRSAVSGTIAEARQAAYAQNKATS